MCKRRNWLKFSFFLCLLILASIQVRILGASSDSSSSGLGEQEAEWYPANLATHVLVGEVKSIESRWEEPGPTIYSYVKIRVEECLKGAIQGEEVTVKMLGGEVGDVGLIVSSEPIFAVGEKVKVFLELRESGEFTVVGGQLGKVLLSSGSSAGSLVAAAALGYNYTGIHWADSALPVKYNINQNVPNAQAVAVRNSFQTWEDDPGSYMDYTYNGTTTRTGSLISDGCNVVSWGSLGLGILGVTYLWHNTVTNLISEFDIVFSTSFTWSTADTCPSGQYDVQSVGTHEVGHTLYLEHVDDPNQIMYPYLSDGTIKRTLGAGDIAGIRYIYPQKWTINIRTLDSSRNILPSCTVNVTGIGSKISNSKGWANFTSVGNGTYAVIVKWQGSKVNQTSVTVSLSNVTREVLCRVYSLNFTFKNSDGTADLYADPSYIQILCPNGTIRTISNYSISRAQNGTYTVTSILWEGIDVVPSPFPSTSLTKNDRLTINCLVYDLRVKVTDLYGLPVSGAIVAVTLPNGTTVTAQTSDGGVAIFIQVPQGSFNGTVSYLGQTDSIFGDVAQASTTPASAKVNFSPVVILSILIPVVAGVIVFIFWRRRRKALITPTVLPPSGEAPPQAPVTPPIALPTELEGVPKKICRNCGAENIITAVYCRKCGHSM